MSKYYTSPILILVGPTAVGKTSLALSIAQEFNCEIINVDSMQVYRYMDIGTAKPTMLERKGISHHLIDIVDPDKEYDAARFSFDAKQAVKKILDSDKVPLLTGGTGLYLNAFLFGMDDIPVIPRQYRVNLKQRLKDEGKESLYKELVQVDPEAGNRIHPNDSQRLLRALEIYEFTQVTWSSYIGNQAEKQKSAKDNCKYSNVLQIALDCERSKLYDRINRRVELMIGQGLEEEVKKLMDMGYDTGLKSMQSIGYRHMTNFIKGTWSREKSTRLLARDTRRYAKRQFTWFKKQPGLEWFGRTNHKKIISRVKSWLV